MAQETIGVKDNQNYFVGKPDAPVITPTFPRTTPNADSNIEASKSGVPGNDYAQNPDGSFSAPGQASVTPTTYPRTPSVQPGLNPSESTNYSNAEKTLGTPNTVKTELDSENELIAGRRAQADDAISKIEQYANDQKKTAEQGAAAVAAATGMSGSNAGATMVDKAGADISDKTSAQIAQILLGINDQAQKDTVTLQQNEQARATNDITALNSISDARQKSQASAQQNISNLAKIPGFDWDAFKQTPYYQQLLDSSGMDDTSAELYYNSQKALASQIQWDTKDATVLGDGRELILGTDPLTGQIKKFYLDPAPEGYQTTLKDGLPYWQKLGPDGQPDPTAPLLQAPLTKDQQTPEYHNYQLAGGFSGTGLNFNDWLAKYRTLTQTVTQGDPANLTNQPTSSSSNLDSDSTLKDFFGIYAPASDNNDPNNYASVVAKQLGVDVNTPLTELKDKVPQIADAITTHENMNKNYPDLNNPGGLKFTGQPGATNSGKNNFAKFATPEQGRAALEADITAKINKASNAPSYDQYGLLSNTDFNPNNDTDKAANLYLNYYLKNAAFPTSYQLGMGRTASSAKKFADAQSRAQDLYFAATGSSLPDVNILKGNKTLITANNKLLNQLNVQEGTIGKNFKLTIDNLDKNDINQNSQPINDFLDMVKNLWGDPNVAQYLTQNGTLQNEVGSLIAIKNASGTTVADKLASAGLVPKNASEDQQKAILKILLQEAENGVSTLNQTNADLYKQIDPLEQSTENPNRQSKSDTGPSGDSGNTSNADLLNSIPGL